MLSRLDRLIVAAASWHANLHLVPPGLVHVMIDERTAAHDSSWENAVVVFPEPVRYAEQLKDALGWRKRQPRSLLDLLLRRLLRAVLIAFAIGTKLMVEDVHQCAKIL